MATTALKNKIIKQKKYDVPMYLQPKIKDPIAYMKKSFKKNKKEYVKFLKNIDKGKLSVRGLDSLASGLNEKAFNTIDCLKCANCCKTMTPTYTKTDVKRISKHLGMSVHQYHEKYLEKDKTGDYMNVKQPCQFLKKDNKCAIYPVRPKDCSGFPHTQSKNFKQFIPDTHIQNIEYCPITMYVVENMFDRVVKQGLTNVSSKNA